MMRNFMAGLGRTARSVYLWIRAVITRRARERDLAEELQLHIERETERNIEQGMAPAAARAKAHRMFGNVELIKEHSRDARGTRWLDELRQDTRYAFRDIARRPMFAALVIATLAVGIGVNSAAFSVLNLLFQPIAVPDPSSVVSLELNSASGRFSDKFSYQDLRVLRTQVPSLRGLVGSSGLVRVIFSRRNAEAVPRDASVSFVSDDYFSLLGGRMVLGRAILASDNESEGASRVAVLSGRFWEAEFGSDSGVIGQTVTISETAVQVIGVANDDFAGEGFELRAPDVWVPAMMRQYVWRDRDSTVTAANAPWLDLTGRLAPDAALERVKLEVGALNGQIASLHQVPDSAVRMTAYRPGVLGRVTLAELSGALSIGMFAPVLILLIACANLTNVMLTRAASRQHELGVRISLGASRARIVRQLMVESAVLAIVGSAIGLFITRVLISALAVQLFASFGHGDPVTAATRIVVDANVLLVTVLVATATVFAVGMLPALRATRLDITNVLKGEGGSTGGTATKSRLRNGLVVMQVACSAVLLLVAGSFARSATRTGNTDVGFDASRLVVAKIHPTMTNGDSTLTRDFHREMAARLRRVPTISEIAEIGSVPFEGVMIASVSPEGAPPTARPIPALFLQVSPNYFGVVGIPLSGGRTFERREGIEKPEVVIVSESFAKAMWPGENAVGKRIRSSTVGSGATVVGIARDVSISSPGGENVPAMYVPLVSHGATVGESGTLIMSVSGDAASTSNEIIRTIRAYDPTVFSSVFTLTSAIDRSESVRAGRSFAIGASILGGIALVLAAVGLYGVASFAVAQRTREIGIRMALGANKTQVLRESLQRMGRLAAFGILFGAIGGVIVLLGLRALLSGLAPFSAAAFAGVMLLLILTSLIAAWVPARRATRISPMVALRS